MNEVERGEFDLGPIEEVLAAVDRGNRGIVEDRTRVVGEVYNCSILERERGNGKISVLEGPQGYNEVTCERLNRGLWCGVIYDERDSNEDCPYVNIGIDEVKIEYNAGIRKAIWEVEKSLEGVREGLLSDPGDGSLQEKERGLIARIKDLKNQMI